MNSTELTRKTQEVKEWLGEGTLNFMGIPFAGKDTQAERFAETFGREDVRCLSSGQIIRDAIFSGDLTPEEQAQVESGELVSSSVFYKIVMTSLEEYRGSDNPLILSGVGKKDGEQEPVHAAVRDLGHPTLVVPYMEIDLETAQQRASVANRGRADDDPQSVARRFDVFAEETKPVIDFYETQGLLLPLKGDGTEDEVYRDFIGSLHDFAS